MRSPRDVGALIRAERHRLGLDQKALAAKVGVSRQWVVGVEGGKARAALGLVLRTFNALGITLQAESSKGASDDRITIPGAVVDIDAIVDKARRRRT